jgi:uncharacterized surface protein with fasciclin (FAS1) repeats
MGIVDFVVANPDLALSAALVRASLVGTFSCSPFTLFAPSNQRRFDALSSDISTLSTNDESPHLAHPLAHHVR